MYNIISGIRHLLKCRKTSIKFTTEVIKYDYFRTKTIVEVYSRYSVATSPLESSDDFCT